MKRFAARAHHDRWPVVHIGLCWEDGGYTCDEQGDPIQDAMHNEIVYFRETELDPEHWEELFEAYSDSPIEEGEVNRAREWLEEECGLDMNQSDEVIARWRDEELIVAS